MRDTPAGTIIFFAVSLTVFLLALDYMVGRSSVTCSDDPQTKTPIVSRIDSRDR